MDSQFSQQKINSSSSQSNPVIQPLPPKVIYEKPKTSRRRVLFFSCAVVLLLLACFCSILAVFPAFIGSAGSITNITYEDSDIIIREKMTSDFGDRASFNISKIAIVDILGVINYSVNSEILPDGANNRTVIAQINRAKNDEAVKAIIMRFNSPGGVVSAAEPICRAIKEANKSKPVYAFIDTEGASLAYLLPNCTKFIYSRPDAITGSIGVRVDLLDLSGILERLGARQTTITNTSGTKKAQEGLFDKNSEEYKQLQAMLDETYVYFLDKVWEGRKDKNNGLTYEKLKTYADGRIFSGLQAKKLGLVDEIGYFEDVINGVINRENLEDQRVQIVEYQIEYNFLAGLFGATTQLLNLVNGSYQRTTKYQLVMITN